MENVLVTGGAGFIGSHVVEGLLEKGFEVKVVDNLFTGKKQNLSSVLKQIDFVKADIRSEKQMLEELKGIDFVLHLAALRSVIESTKQPNLYNEVNILGTVNLLEAARLNGVKRVVFTSSSSIYGASEKLPQSEMDAPQPLCPYALTKLVGEQYCRMYSELFGLETASLRYFNVFGPRQDPGSQYACVIPLFINAFLENKQPIIFGDGLQTRDFTYVSNIAEANIAAMLSSKVGKGEVFNIARGDNKTVLELFKKVRALLGREGIEPNFQPPRPGEARHTKADQSKAKGLLGFECKVDFEEGLKKTVEWFSAEFETQKAKKK
jgi:UDP-glucose 4-epimerase